MDNGNIYVAINKEEEEVCVLTGNQLQPPQSVIHLLFQLVNQPADINHNKINLNGK